MADTYPITESTKREILTSSTFFVFILLIICGQMQVLKHTVYTKPKNSSIRFYFKSPLCNFHSVLWPVTQVSRALSKPISLPAFSDSIHLCFKISSLSAKNSWYSVEPVAKWPVILFFFLNSWSFGQ